jgi:glycine dehydrogenase
MKLNSASELIPITWSGFSDIHPFSPKSQKTGYKKLIDLLNKKLLAVTQMDCISLQPNSGANGEFAALCTIRAYYKSIGEIDRNIVLIPSSAHGTNPASASIAGFKVDVVKSDNLGNIDVADLNEKVKKYSKQIACMMITYPSTHGVFEETILEVSEIIHRIGGQIYIDGANMNAQCGLTAPGTIGGDICHLNLHKTFAIPHGGGGPGVGPICAKKHLEPFLPNHIENTSKFNYYCRKFKI